MPLRRLVIVLFFAGLSGCRLFMPPGPSAVAQGRYFSTGNPSYDEFFVRLYRMQMELKAAPETLTSIRRDVIRGLELPPTADDSALKSALSTKAAELSGRGVTLAVERAAEPGAPARLAIAGAPAAADQPLVKTLADAFTRTGELREHVGPWQKELDWLPQTGIALDGSVEAAFVGQSRATREDVRENLSDGQRVVALMEARLKEVDANAAALEGLLTSALGEKKSEPLPVPSAKPRPRPAPRAPAPEAAPKPTPPPSKPAPPAASDETPAAPKPKQGTAKPDFEP